MTRWSLKNMYSYNGTPTLKSSSSMVKTFPSIQYFTHRQQFRYTTSSRLRASTLISQFFHSIAAPPITATSPPATAQSGASIAAAAALVAAVLAELEVAVLVLEVAEVAEVELVAEDVSV